jgi:hypothetical protein
VILEVYSLKGFPHVTEKIIPRRTAIPGAQSLTAGQLHGTMKNAAATAANTIFLNILETLFIYVILIIYHQIG